MTSDAEALLLELLSAFDLPDGRKRRRRLTMAIRAARAMVVPEPMLPSEKCTVCGRPAHDCVDFRPDGSIRDPRCYVHLPEGGACG